MSDGELAHICATSPAEDRLLATGCLGTAVALPLLLLAGLIFGSAAVPYFGGLLLALLIVFAAHHVLSRPKRRYRDELAYRSGKCAFSRYVEEARNGLCRPAASLLEDAPGKGGADWIVLFTARSLPHGDHRWLRLELREGSSPSARADLRISGRTPVLMRVATDIPGDNAAAMWGMLQALDMAVLTSVPSLVLDGAPCNLAVLRASPRAVAVASCNLSGFERDEPEHPTSRTCAKLYDLTRQMAAD